MNTKLLSLLSLCLVLGALMLACGGSSDNANTANTANASNTAKANTNTATNTSTTATTSGDKIGVPECDDFIAKYEACVNGKVPEAARATVKTSLETWRNSWKELAKTPQGKAGLAQACKAASDQAKTSMNAYGCSW
jgi:flagellar hook-associated protein FlgK